MRLKISWLGSQRIIFNSTSEKSTQRHMAEMVPTKTADPWPPMHVQFIHQSFNSNGSISLLLAAKYYIAHSKSVMTSDRKNSTTEKKNKTWQGTAERWLWLNEYIELRSSQSSYQQVKCTAMESGCKWLHRQLILLIHKTYAHAESRQVSKKRKNVTA